MSLASAEEQPATSVPTPLWRNWRFQLLWIGSSTATLGVEIADVAYPLLILALTGSAVLAGLFGFLQFAAMCLLGLPVGVLIDRLDRRRVLLAAEAGRALLVGSVAVAAAVHHLTVAHMLVTAVLLGIGTTFGGPVRMLMIRAVVPRQQLTAALTQDEVREGATSLSGPPLGGLLYGLSRTLPFLCCALSFAVSFVCALLVRPPREPAGADGEGGRGFGGMFDGFRELWRSPLLRHAIIMITTYYLAAMATVLSVIVILEARGTSPKAIGLALTGTAVGTLLGSIFVGRLHRLLRPGRLLVLVSATVAVSVALLAVPWDYGWVFAALALGALLVPAMRVLVDVLIFRQVPDERRGRTVVATMTTFAAGPPLGALLAGLLLQLAGGRAAVLTIAVLVALSALYGLSDRHVRQAAWPADDGNG
ncbi:MFS transporter [Dactylosporangium sp. NPDC000555]|uniref:MFS transporter n=1 Tax=Dactylosporangium sp. NPDC000555 TaxID=3154260 RepID=UPI0033188E69